jgi:putative flippase GtrA
VKAAQLTRFVGVGVLNTAVYYSIYLLLGLIAPYLLAHVVAFAVAMVVSFFANCHFTFRVPPTWRRFVAYPATVAVNFVLSTAGLVCLVDFAGLGPRVAAIAAAAIAVPFTFVLTRRVLRGQAVVA